eukprot:scaffold98342_cov48-Phaeocystis_antarctica.AAC.1
MRRRRRARRNPPPCGSRGPTPRWRPATRPAGGCAASPCRATGRRAPYGRQAWSARACRSFLSCCCRAAAPS